MMNSVTIILWLYLYFTVAIAREIYNLDIAYEGVDFFKEWDFWTESDPTHGYVSYIDEHTARGTGLIATNGHGPAYMGVDHTSYLDPTAGGRKSVRITTQKSFTHGLVIADIQHMPNSICGTWPAFWMFGPNWPNNGEVDIIEGVNQQTDNIMSLHTSANCVMPNVAAAQLGTVNSDQCDGSLNGNSGCGSTAQKGQNTYGKDFNAHGGGVYATEWTSDHIKIWFFPRHSIPHDIQSGCPDPSTWSKPQAFFQGSSSCNIDTHFANQNLVFDTTFCGDWAGGVWWNDGGICSEQHTISCEQFVAGRPEAFRDAYWLINSLKVYQLKQDSAEPPTVPMHHNTTTAQYPITFGPTTKSTSQVTVTSYLTNLPATPVPTNATPEVPAPIIPAPVVPVPAIPVIPRSKLSRSTHFPPRTFITSPKSSPTSSPIRSHRLR